MSGSADDHDDVDRAGALSGARPAPRALAVAAGLTVLVGFGLGFALAGRDRAGTVDTAATVPTTTLLRTVPGGVGGPTATATTTPDTSTAPPTAPVPSTTSTTLAPTTTTEATTTTRPPTTPAPTLPAPVVTAPPPPSTTTTTATQPARLVAAWTQDAQGRLVIPRVGSATFTITNVGGLQTQWLLAGTGFSGPGGTTVRGILDPGQATPVTVVAAAGLPPGEVAGTISVLGPNPLDIPFVVV